MAMIRPCTNKGRALPYQSTQEARHPSSFTFSALALSSPASSKCSESFLRKRIAGEFWKRCSSYPLPIAHVIAFLFPKNQLMDKTNAPHQDLQALARQAMLANGFQPDFPPPVQQQLADLKTRPPQGSAGAQVRDLRNLLWSSIDNDTSKDLDQIEFAERLPNGQARVLVGIADVDCFVAKDSPIDAHAARETTTVYTGVRNFHMLPEELSTDATSLLERDNELCLVIEFT